MTRRLRPEQAGARSIEHFLTSGEAARLLGISKPTVARAVQRGLLRPALVTPGHHRRFLETDLLAFRTQLLTHEDGGLELSGRPVPHRVLGETIVPEPVLSAGD